MRPAFSLGDPVSPLPWPALSAAILDGVERFPDGKFLYFDRSGVQAEVTFRATLDRARRLVAGLRERGLNSADALLIALSQPADIIPAIWATALGGFIGVPFGRFAGSARDCASGDAALRHLEGIFRGCFVLTDAGAPWGADRSKTSDIGTLLDAGQPLADVGPVDASPADLRFAIPTSGTTGMPKLAGLSDGAAIARWWPEMPAAIHAAGFLSWSDFAHVLGLGLAMPNLPVKAHLDARRFVAAPLSWLDALEATGATHATMTNFGMSLIVRAIAEAPERQWTLGHVRKIGIGAEAISRKTCSDFLKALTPFGLREDALILGYGLTECGPVVGGGIAFTPDSADTTDAPPELDRPTKGHAVRIVGENGYLLREGEAGRIEVRGPTMTIGYVGDEAATAQLFTPDQWIRTGDLGLLRDGRLTVTGREKETVIVNARKYTCQEIEAAVANRVGISEVYAAPLFGTHSGMDAPGAACAVFVVMERPEDQSLDLFAGQVRAACAGAFRFAPKAVAIVSPEELPTSAMGKVRRLALADLLERPEVKRRTSLLAAADQPSSVDSGTSGVEARIARIWQKLLRQEEEIDRDVDFFALGGDSLLALRMSFLIENEFGTPMRIEQFTGKLSIAGLARMLSGASPETAADNRTSSPGEKFPDWMEARLRDLMKGWPGTPATPDGFLRRVGEERDGVPLFWCMQTQEEATAFAEAMDGRYPVYLMRSGMMLLDYETPYAGLLVERYLEEIRTVCPAGPLVLGGTCQGVNIALAATRRLVEQGREVRLLAAADCRLPDICGENPVPVPLALFAAIGSKNNPYRYFLFPEAGLRKFAPGGLRVETVDAGYAQITLAPAVSQLAQAVDSAILWAGSIETSDRRAAAIRRRPGAYQRTVSSGVQQMDLVAGERATVKVDLKNDSGMPWHPFARSGLTVGNHWLTKNGAMLSWSDGRARLRELVKKGEEICVDLAIRAPDKPGAYMLEIDLVEEGVCWFSEFASSPLRIPVNVRAEAAATSIFRKGLRRFYTKPVR